MKKLTIVILTYNRAKSLLHQLKSIEVQGHYDDIEVVISDNASDYDVNTLVKENLCEDFQNIVNVYRRDVNIGGASNIAYSFQLVKTPWMWMMSDDDPAKPGSLEQVLSDIDKYSDACWLKYSVRESEKYPLQKVDNLVDLFNAFDGNYGQYVFMSTNVFAMDKIRPFIGFAPMYVHTCFSQLIPAMMSIKKNKAVAYILPSVVVDYTPGAQSYQLHYALSNYCNLVCSNFSMTDSECISYKRLFSLSYKSLYLSLLEIDGRKQRHEFYKKYMIFSPYFKDRLLLTLLYRIPVIFKIWKIFKK